MQYSKGFNLTKSDVDKMQSALISKMIRQSKIKIRMKDQNQKDQNHTRFIERPEGINA